MICKYQGDHMIKKDHFLSLDGFRGVAAILVVLRHTLPFFGGNPFYESYLAVDLFFLLSGAVVARAYEARLLGGLPLKSFVWIRMLRLYPLYFLGTSIGIVAALTGAIQYEKHLGLAAVLGLLFIPGMQASTLFPLNSPAWSLSAEVAVNVFYGWKVRLLNDRVLLAVVGVAMLALIAFLAFSPGHSLDAGFKRKTFYVSYIRVALSFAAGILLYRIYTRRVAGPIVSNGKVVLAMCGVAGLLMSSPPLHLVAFFDFFAVCVGFPVLIYAGMRYQTSGWLSHLCKFLGIVSYPIYIVHSPIAELIRLSAPRLIGHPVDAYAPVAGIIFLMAISLLAWLLHHYYDEPIRRYIGAKVARRAAIRAASGITPTST